MDSIIAELRRRKVFRVAIAYAIVAWVVVQIVVSVKSPLNLPDWADTLVIVLLVAGFPVTLVLGWVFDVTPSGIQRTDSADPPGSVSPEIAGSAIEPPSEKSIAVLPFVNMSSDPEQEYFSDGISEELLNQLANIPGLHVAGRTSSFFFKGKNENLRAISENLNVAHVLEGSVRKAGNRVRITAQLIKASDGFHLWSKTFDRELDDIFAIQDETAQAVADALSVALGIESHQADDGGTQNFAAYDAYLAGLALSQKDGPEQVEKALEKFEEAVKLDPEFADAWSQLALTSVLAGQNFFFDRAAQFNERADIAARRAAEAAPGAISSLAAMAYHHTHHRNWLEAEDMFERIARSNGNDPQVNLRYGNFLAFVGKIGRAREVMDRAVRAEPLSLTVARFRAHVTEFAGDVEGALQQYRAALKVPGNPYFTDVTMAVAGMQLGDEQLIRECLGRQVPNMSGTHREMTTSMLELMDDPPKALTELRRMYKDQNFLKEGTQLPMAIWASFLGDDELALDAYESILSSPFTAFLIIWRPLHRKMRQLPGFKDLLSKLGLVDYWRTTGNWGDFCRPIGGNDFEVYR